MLSHKPWWGAFDDHGMEAICEFDVDDVPVTVAVDSKGASDWSGLEGWRARIAGFKAVKII